MSYTWFGDINPENGGCFLDLDEMKKWGDFCPCIQITDLDSAIGFYGAVMIEQGSVYIPKDDAKRKSALDCIGWDHSQEPDDRTLADAMLAYGGVDRDLGGLSFLTIQTLEDGPMEFDNWKADRRILSKDFKGWVEAAYGVSF